MPSLRARLLNRWLRTVEKPAINRIPSVPATRARQKFDRQMRMIYGLPRGLRSIQVAGFDALETGPADAPVPVLYLHGGAYLIGSPQAYAGLARRLARRCGLRVIVPAYPLAPENPFPAAPDAALEIYRALAAQGPVFLGGDSAGGGLALSLLGQICAHGLPQPLQTFVLSPWTDLTLASPSIAENANCEAVLPHARMVEGRDAYLNGAPADDPRASPIFADFKGASAVRIWVGDTEILLDDSRRMAAHLQAQGVDVDLTVARDLPHVWPIFARWQLPESDATLGDIAAGIHTSLASAKR